MVQRSDLPIAEVESLILSGDISLEVDRALFKTLTSQDTILTDADIIACHAAQDDDYGHDDIVDRMILLEADLDDLAFGKGKVTDNPDDPAIAPLVQFIDGLITFSEAISKLGGQG